MIYIYIYIYIHESNIGGQAPAESKYKPFARRGRRDAAFRGKLLSITLLV